jgi:hypothetical protein
VKLANCGLNCGFEDIIIVQFGGEIPQFSVIKMHRSLIIKICTAVSNRSLYYALHWSGRRIFGSYPQRGLSSVTLPPLPPIFEALLNTEDVSKVILEIDGFLQSTGRPRLLLLGASHCLP